MKILFKFIWFKCTEALCKLLSPFVDGWKIIAEYVNREEDRKTMDDFRGCQGVPGEISMWDALSFVEGYDDITFAAMELVLEKGPDALMYQLSYSDIDLIKEEYPTVYERAVELGILTEEE